MKTFWTSLTLSVGRDFLIAFFAGAVAALVVLSTQIESGLFLISVLAVLLLAAASIAWRRLRRIADVATIASSIGRNTLNLRLPERDLPVEVLPIVRSVNGAFERLERAAEGEREFLRRAAHHLRTPMTVLSARIDSLDDRETGEILRGDVKELSRIVSQLLQLNEIDALPDSKDTVADLGAVGDAVRASMTSVAEKRGSRITLEQPEMPVLVRGDPNVIEIAFRNLVENAIQHSPPGATIRLRIGADGRLDVIDPGTGIIGERNDKIFEAFWSSNFPEGGAGLGLTIVRRVAERYGAAVTVGAAPHRGAMVTLCFQPATVPQSGLDEVAAKAALPWAARLRRRASPGKAAI